MWIKEPKWKTELLLRKDIHTIQNIIRKEESSIEVSAEILETKIERDIKSIIRKEKEIRTEAKKIEQNELLVFKIRKINKSLNNKNK